MAFFNTQFLQWNINYKLSLKVDPIQGKILSTRRGGGGEGKKEEEEKVSYKTYTFYETPFLYHDGCRTFQNQLESSLHVGRTV
jgi:hypothetical protein